MPLARRGTLAYLHSIPYSSADALTHISADRLSSQIKRSWFSRLVAGCHVQNVGSVMGSKQRIARKAFTGARTHRGRDRHARQRSAPGIPNRELARSTVGRDKGLCAAASDAFINTAFKVRAFLFGARMPHRRPTIDASRNFDFAVQSHPSLCCQRHCCLLPGPCKMKQAAIGRPPQSKIRRPCRWPQIPCRCDA